MEFSLSFIMGIVIFTILMLFGLVFYDGINNRIDCTYADDFRKDGLVKNPLYDIDTPQKICGDLTNNDNLWTVIAVLPIILVIALWVIFNGGNKILSGLGGRKND